MRGRIQRVSEVNETTRCNLFFFFNKVEEGEPVSERAVIMPNLANKNRMASEI